MKYKTNYTTPKSLLLILLACLFSIQQVLARKGKMNEIATFADYKNDKSLNDDYINSVSIATENKKLEVEQPSSITVTVSGRTSLCNGISTGFQAGISESVTNQVYRWKRNGQPVYDNTNGLPQYVYQPTKAFVAGETVSCEVSCTTSNGTYVTVTSNILTISIAQPSMPTMSVSANYYSFCVGDVITFSANLNNSYSYSNFRWKMNGISVGSNSSVFQTTQFVEGNTVTLTADVMGYCLSSNTVTASNTMPIQVQPKFPVAVTISSDKTSVCSGGSVTFSAHPTHGGVVPQYQWYINNNPLAGQTGETLIFSNFNNADVVSVSMTSTAKCVEGPRTVRSNNVTISAVATPIVSATSYYFEDFDEFKLTAIPVGTGTVCRWYESADPGAVYFEGNTFIPKMGSSLSKKVYVASYDPEIFCESSKRELTVNVAPNFGKNYIRTIDVLKESVPHDSLINGLMSNDRRESTAFFDGLGRGTQTVQKQASPSGKDMVEMVEYDAISRAFKKYLPYTSGTDGNYKHASLAEQSAFYIANGDKIVNDNYPFAITQYEASSLSRVLNQGAPGAAWQPDKNSVKMAYGANRSNEVRQWILNSNGQPYSPGFYSAGTLTLSISKDENGNELREFTDKLGRVILNRSFVNGQEVNTYNVYDDFGLIRYVLPPECVAQWPYSNSSLVQEHLDLFAFGYKYDERNRLIEKKIPGTEVEYFVYDNADQLVMSQTGEERKGNSWKFIKYDVLGREIISGLYTHPATATREEIKAMVIAGAIYEMRTASNFIVQHGYTVNTFPNLTDNNVTPLIISYYDDYDFNNNGVNDVNASGDVSEVSNKTKGMLTARKERILGSNQFLLSVTFVDRYGRPVQVIAENHLGGQEIVRSTLDFEGKLLKSIHKHSIPGKSDTYIEKHFTYDNAGRLLKSENRVWGNVHWENLYYVAVQGNSIRGTGHSGITAMGATSTQKIPAYEDGGVEFKIINPITNFYFGLSAPNSSPASNSIKFALSFSSNGGLMVFESGVYKGIHGTYQPGDVVSVERKNNKVYYKCNGKIIYTAGATSNEVLCTDITFTRSGILVDDIRMILGGKTVIAKNEYNELGQLVSKSHHDLNLMQTSFLQKADFAYNIRGWMTNINDVILNNPAENDLFGIEFKYESGLATGLVTPNFNGNISEVIWNTRDYQSKAPKVQQAYGFRYDGLNRLTDASYVQKSPTGNWNMRFGGFNEGSITYDLNGNIKRLSRYELTNGLKNIIDSLTYHYKGNQLHRVDDWVITGRGFVDGVKADNEMTYDKNGNIQTDANKGFTFKHNIYNLLEEVNNGASHIRYVYSASGVRLQKVVTDVQGNNTYITISDYVGAFEYKNGELQHIMHEEGRLVPNGDGYTYQYFLKDHLGNVRVSYDKDPSTGLARILQENHYYPFGLRMTGGYDGGSGNKYLYNGKELQDDGFGGKSLGWLNYGARMYNAELGRFVEVDPLGYKPQNIAISPFAYTANNPISRIDPDGRDWFYYQAADEEEKTWHWHKGNKATYTNADGKQVTTKKGYNYLVSYSYKKKNAFGASVGTITVFKQNKIVMQQSRVFTGSGALATGGNPFKGGFDAAGKGNYMMYLHNRSEMPNNQKVGNGQTNPKANFGIEKIPQGTIIVRKDGSTHDVNVDYGNGRIRLNPVNDNMEYDASKDRGYYLHGKQAWYNRTHGCVCDKSENIFNYFWDGEGSSVKSKTPFSINIPYSIEE